jgi:accessory colonization factor AcfC
MPDKLKLTAEDNVFVALALAHLADNWPGILCELTGPSPDTPAKLRKMAGQFLRAKQVSITFWPKASWSKQTEGEIDVLAPRRRARRVQDRE